MKRAILMAVAWAGVIVVMLITSVILTTILTQYNWLAGLAVGAFTTLVGGGAVTVLFLLIWFGWRIADKVRGKQLADW